MRLNWKYSHIIFLISFTSLAFPIKSQENSDPCPFPENKKAVKLYHEAIEKVKSNKSESIKLLNIVIDMEPDFGRAHFMLGDLLIKGNRMIEAEPYLKRSLELCPDLNSGIYLKLGSIQFSDKRFQESLINLEKFLHSNEGKDSERNDAGEMIKICKLYIERASKPVPFNPKPVRGICSDLDEYLAALTPDNQTFYFTRRTYQTILGSLGEEKKSIERFSFSRATDSQTFERGSPLPFPFNQSGNEGGASLTADNKFIYFTTCKSDGTKFNCDIYFSSNTKGEWSEIKNLGKPVNRDDSWDSQPAVSSDGKTLYFASNRQGGLGELDIWKSTKNPDGSWNEPENLGPEINSAGSEKSPFIHSDGQTIYFSSTGKPGFGGFDIFFSKQDENGRWSEPKNIGYPINSEMDDLGFFVSTDGKTGYFASDKLQGSGGWDIYSFDLYEEARPERVFFFSGELKDENNEIVTNAKVEIKNIRTKEVTTIEVDSTSGKYVAVMKFTDDHILTVKKQNAAFTSQYLSTKDTSLNKPKKMDLEVKEIKIGSTYKINNIQFPVNSAEINDQTVIIIKEFAEYLNENPKLKVAIHGHTDNVGNDKDNLELSKNRAKKVYDLLVESKISIDRLSYAGFGSGKPISSNISDTGRAQNRRTEFVIVGK